MKTIHTPLLALAAIALLPATAWSQDRPERDRPRGDMERTTERLRESVRGTTPQEVRRLMEMRRQQASETEGWRIGVMVDPVDPLLRRHLKLPENSGVVVDRVVDNSPAAKAGLKAGDLILATGDKPVGDLEGLKKAVVAAGKSGKPLVLSVLKDGKKEMVRIAPPVHPKEGNRVGPAPTEQRSAAGADGNERIARALREMRAELDRQREAIQRLEKRIEEMSRERRRN